MDGLTARCGTIIGAAFPLPRNMKRVVLVIILINLFLAVGCGLTRVDPAEGQQLVERLLDDVKNEDYSRLGDYYISSFMASEDPESMRIKFDKLHRTAGAMQSWEKVSGDQRYDEGTGFDQLTLVYKVRYGSVTLRETFIVVKDEGHTGILFHNMENWELDEAPAGARAAS